MREIDLERKDQVDLVRVKGKSYHWLGQFLVVVVVVFIARLLCRAQPLNELVGHLSDFLRRVLVRVTLRRLLVPRVERLLLDDVVVVELEQNLRHALLVEDLRSNFRIVADDHFQHVEQILLSFGIFEAQLRREK